MLEANEARASKNETATEKPSLDVRKSFTIRTSQEIRREIFERTRGAENNSGTESQLKELIHEAPHEDEQGIEN